MSDRLTAAAALGGLRQRAWSLLIVLAFLVPAAAGAAAPMFAEASDNATFQLRRGQIPATARQDDAAVVRLSAAVGSKSADQQAVVDDVRTIPNLTEPDLTGGSIGLELAAPRFWELTVADGARTDRGRFFAVGDPAAELVPVGPPSGRAGLWIPRPMAANLGAKPGDPITLTVVIGTQGERYRTTSAVAGIYEVDEGGRLPADVPGSHRWVLRHGDTPGDTEYQTLPAYLLVGDVATVEPLARAVHDQIFWSVEAALAPGTTMAEAARTAAAVEELRREYATRTPPEGERDSPLAFRFASGIGRIVAAARTTTDTVRHRTRPVEWAAIAVGLASVLAVALLSARRRDRELSHAVAAGMSSARIGGLWLLEHVLPAALGAALGWLVAWQLVDRLGPPGAIEDSLLPAARAAGLAALGGLLTVGAVGAAAAFRRVRPVPPATARRQLPWAAMLVVAALVAAGGLAGAGGPSGGVDLLVPLLVLAAIGVVAGGLPGRLAGRRRTSLPPSPGRAVVWLARRRLGSGGAERRLAVVVVTAGLGMLLFALSAVDSTAGTAEDRIAVAAGAEAVAPLEGSYVLDPGAVSPPRLGPHELPPTGPVPGVRVPPLPAGDTVVWHTDVLSPVDAEQKDLLIIDPARFAGVALWGQGADLAAARDAVAKLAADPGTSEGSVRVIAVADPASASLDAFPMKVGFDTQNFTVVARAEAFPGMRGRPMYVAAADQVLGNLGIDDPRLKPLTAMPPGAQVAQATLWSSGGPAAIQTVAAAHGVKPERVDTAAQLRSDAAYVGTARARGYQVAIAGYLALLAVLTLCLYAQRTAVLRRPADLMLARVGLGRSRVRRARALEFVLLAVVAFAAAVAGVAALAPLGGRLLDDQPGLRPRFAFQLSPAAVAITAGAAVVAIVLAVALTASGSAAEEVSYRDD
ncbi:FtsX-like permease family protein [Paractinoplanes globisporus]|uniref:FtsX-like permease family protein n=1 Tax=Paractinoplanes globisporus TaxID=113565 RepID=A0ABW6WCQ6_9ACTN|nr:FtsX-like permease family protein [Actinoplanes globisporus]